MIPGANLLASALTVIQPQAVDFYKATGRTPNAQGRETVVYAEKRTLYGSFQPIDPGRVAFYGLEAGKDYANFYAQVPFANASREGPADKLVFNGQAYEVQKVTKWLAQDGWDGVLAVRTGLATDE